jgi:hypothetical protein
MRKLNEGWLVMARYNRMGAEFSAYTVPCDVASDAISKVARMGFALGESQWVSGLSIRH